MDELTEPQRCFSFPLSRRPCINQFPLQQQVFILSAAGSVATHCSHLNASVGIDLKKQKLLYPRSFHCPGISNLQWMVLMGPKDLTLLPECAVTQGAVPAPERSMGLAEASVELHFHLNSPMPSLEFPCSWVLASCISVPLCPASPISAFLFLEHTLQPDSCTWISISESVAREP